MDEQHNFTHGVGSMLGQGLKMCVTLNSWSALCLETIVNAIVSLLEPNKF